MTQIVTYLLIAAASIVLGYILSKMKYSRWNKHLLALIKERNNADLVPAISTIPEGIPAEYKTITLELDGLINRRAAYKEPQTATTEDAADEFKKQLDNSLIINELGQKLTSSLVLNDTFQHLYSTLNSMTDAAVVELGVYNAQKEEWSILSNLNGKENSTYKNHIAEWVKSNDRPVILSDAERDFGRYVHEPLIAGNGEMAQSVVSFPIHSADGITGTITAISFRKNAFDKYFEESIEHLTGFISVALQNAITHEQLNLLKIRAEQSEKYEQQFLANMSHEIRTPMNAVLGMTNLLLDSKVDSKQERYLSAIKTSSQNLLIIINDILDLSKLEAGKMEIEQIPFKISDVIGNVSDVNKYKAEEKGLKFEVNISPKVPLVVKGDPTRLNQILTNLCSNAIKFTDTGKITVDVEKQSGSEYIKFTVTDTGIGIPEDKQHLLFGNFKQVDSSTFRKYGGTGLGLSISKTLVELQGGTVEVNSVLGKGSEFSVSVPYPAGDISEVQSSNKEDKIDYSGLTGIRILIAEDNEYNQIVVNDTLESLIPNVKITLADNGLIAVEEFSKSEFDLILMDAQMPEMDGLDATRAIRKLEVNTSNKIPIIALTASVHKADIERCFEAGMNSFVPKPFTRSELLDTLAKYYQNTNPLASTKEPEKVEKPTIETPTDPEAETSVVDMEFLKEFTEGDPTRMKKYIGMYLKLLPGNISKIKDSAVNSDFQTVAKTIHMMRPHLNYMGMKETASWAATLEDLIKENDDLSAHQESISTHLNNILTNCSASEQELQNILNKFN